MEDKGHYELIVSDSNGELIIRQTYPLDLHISINKVTYPPELKGWSRVELVFSNSKIKSNLERRISMENQFYYFTFGTDERFPFSNGCVKVQASSRSEAVKKFNEKYPPRNDLVNCSFIYDQKAFDGAIIIVGRNHGTLGSEIFSYIHDVL